MSTIFPEGVAKGDRSTIERKDYRERHTVKFFEEFVQKNYMKCEVKETYPIDKTALIKWYDKMNTQSKGTPDEEYIREFAKTFSTNIKHIPFITFYDKCIQVGIEISSEIQRFKENYKDQETMAMLAISGTFDKSQFWVNIIVYKALLGKGLITHIVSSIDGGIIMHKESKIPCQIFYIDDCAYSGEQIIYNTKIVKYESDSDRLKRRNDVSIEIYACTCYLSLTAKELFAEKGIRTLKTSEPFKSMRQYFEEYMSKNTINSFGKQYEPFDLDRHLIYFDHKLADGMSIYNEIMQHGEYYNWREDSDKHLEMFIKGCEGNVEIKRCEAIIWDDNGELVNKIGYIPNQLVACPPSFYKHINWNFSPLPAGNDPHKMTIFSLYRWKE